MIAPFGADFRPVAPITVRTHDRSRQRASELTDRSACKHRIVPTISAFYGILIRMYFSDHPPPHFHVRYGEHKARFSIADGQRIDGDLPARATRLVSEWAGLHRDELEENWRRCEERLPLEPVEPLQ